MKIPDAAKVRPADEERVPRLVACRTLTHRDDHSIAVLRIEDSDGIERTYWLDRDDLMVLGKQMVADATLLAAEPARN